MNNAAGDDTAELEGGVLCEWGSQCGDSEKAHDERGESF